MLSDVCEGPKCLKPDSKFNDTLFGEMLHGYNNRTQHVNQGQVFQMTFRYGIDACLHSSRPQGKLCWGRGGWKDGQDATEPSMLLIPSKES